jgi:hypothetical protein
MGASLELLGRRIGGSDAAEEALRSENQQAAFIERDL